MASDRPNYAPEIRRALVDVRALCDALGLTRDGGSSVKRQAGGGLIVRCVWHQENTPSMSVRIAADGTIAAKCFGCDRGGDALDLVAGARNMSMQGAGFREVLIEAAQLAGLWGIVAELEGRAKPNETPRPAIAPVVPPEPPRDYPPIGEVMALWDSCEPTTDVPDIADYLRGRAIDPDRVDARDLARALPDAGALPRWARCRGGDWREAGYRLIVPMFLPSGELRSVRGWRVGGDSELPKRIPPSGHKASGIVMADERGRAMLTLSRSPARVVVAEGEPDTLVNAIRNNDTSTAVIGIVSGSWSQAVADRVPVGSNVYVRTHLDDAGDRYANEIATSLRRRAFIWRISREAVLETGTR